LHTICLIRALRPPHLPLAERNRMSRGAEIAVVSIPCRNRRRRSLKKDRSIWKKAKVAALICHTVTFAAYQVFKGFTKQSPHADEENVNVPWVSVASLL